jgi:hypothetical protein
MDSSTRALVIARAGNRCEYCQLPQAGYEATSEGGRGEGDENPWFFRIAFILFLMR